MLFDMYAVKVTDMAVLTRLLYTVQRWNFALLQYFKVNWVFEHEIYICVYAPSKTVTQYRVHHDNEEDTSRFNRVV